MTPDQQSTDEMVVNPAFTDLHRSRKTGLREECPFCGAGIGESCHVVVARVEIR